MKKYVRLKYNIFLFVCLAVLTMSSCIDDKGNYDYSILSTAIMEKTNNNNPINVSFVPNKQMHVEPKISFTEGLGAGDYTFEWHYYVQEGTVYNTVEVISRSDSPILDIPVPPILGKQGSYSILLKAINNQTKVVFSKPYIFHMQNLTQNGYLALCEKSGGFDIELIAIYNDTLTLYKNYLTTIACELPRAGRRPIGIATFDDASAPTPYDTSDDRITYSVFISTDQGTDRLKANDYSYKPSYNMSKISYIPQEFIPAQGLIADRIYYTGNHRYYMLMNNNWYFASHRNATYFFSTPVNTTVNSGVYYKAAPHIAICPTGAIMFDEDNHRFMWQSTYDAATNLGIKNK